MHTRHAGMVEGSSIMAKSLVYMMDLLVQTEGYPARRFLSGGKGGVEETPVFFSFYFTMPAEICRGGR